MENESTQADRRTFLAAGASALALLGPRRVRAQAPPLRVGFLYFGTREAALDTRRLPVFIDALRERGYAEGRNLELVARYADSRTERLPALVAELLATRPAVIVATGGPAYEALKKAGGGVPVVVTLSVDPVASGYAQSIARPGGRFTGLTDNAALLGPKHLELLDSVVPRLTLVGVLFNPDNAAHGFQLAAIEQAARERGGKRAFAAKVRREGELDAAFDALRRERAQALIVPGDTFFTEHLRAIAERALAARLAATHALRAFAEAGGLISYGADLLENFRRAAAFVDKIAHGTPPGELPFEHPTQYRLVVNARTAKALGLTLPPSLLARADAVVT